MTGPQGPPSDTAIHPGSGLARLWRTLVEPSHEIEAPEMRRRARMLAALLLFLMAAAAFVTFLVPQIVAPEEHAANRTLAYTGSFVVAVGLVIYWISRTRHYEAAAWLAVFATMGSVTLSLYASQGTLWQDGAPFYLALATILGALLLPLTTALVVVALSLVLPVVFYHTIPTFTAVSLSNTITFLAISSALLLITALVRHYDILQIRTQAGALAESEERYRTLFEASFEGLVLHTGGRILEANETMTKIWGFPRERLVGADLVCLVARRSRAHLLKEVDATHHTAQEAVARRADGSTFPVEFITKPYLFQGRLVHVTGFRDITERKEAEAARTKAKELQTANQRLVEIDRLKTHILNVTSHELNTPITPLRMQVHLLKNNGFGELNERQKHSVEILDRNLRRLSHLVKDILDVSRIEAGRLRLDPKEMELTDLLGKVRETFLVEADKRGIRLELHAEGESWVRADAARVEQAFVNLLSNALKSTPPEGRITIRVRDHDDQVRVEVEDTGIGLSAKQRSRLFRPFDPVNDGHDSPSGSGLGLYITKGIVEGHGGRIELESEGLGKGCTAWVMLPRGIPGRKSGDPEARTGPRTPGPGEKRRMSP